jgi:hypothetical protein
MNAPPPLNRKLRWYRLTPDRLLTALLPIVVLRWTSAMAKHSRTSPERRSGLLLSGRLPGEGRGETSAT